MTMALINKSLRHVLVDAITAAQFAGVPRLSNPDQVTFYEEERVVAYYGGGFLYATPSRVRARWPVSAGHDDYAVEPIRGLPEMPPAGEHILWQGAPSWWEMAKHVFHIRAARVYFLLLIGWRASVHMQAGMLRGALVAALSLLPIAAVRAGPAGACWPGCAAAPRSTPSPTGVLCCASVWRCRPRSIFPLG